MLSVIWVSFVQCEGVVNYKKAIEWLEKAAKQGYAAQKN